MRIKIIVALFFLPAVASAQEQKEGIEAIKPTPKQVIYYMYKTPIRYLPDWKYTYHINHLEKISSYEVRHNGEHLFKYSYRYNEKGLCESEIYEPLTDNVGKTGYTYWQYEYDNKGNVFKEVSYWDSVSHRPSTVKDSMTYDTLDNLWTYNFITYPRSDKGDIVKSKYILSYSRNNLLERQIIIKDQDTTAIHQFTRYNNGLVENVSEGRHYSTKQKLYKSSNATLII